MDELAAMPTITFPCLVVCAGNRRKEQNMIKKSIGFNWGPSAVGNTYWKGVPLRLLLNRAGIHAPGPGARFVCLANGGRRISGARRRGYADWRAHPPIAIRCVSHASRGTAPWLRTTCKFAGLIKP